MSAKEQTSGDQSHHVDLCSPVGDVSQVS